MAAIGLNPIAAASLALVFNTVPVPFGAVGTPTNTAITIVSVAVSQAGGNPEAFALRQPAKKEWIEGDANSGRLEPGTEKQNLKK